MQMNNQPLTSSGQSKILIYGLLLAPTMVLLAGIIPAIFLAFGVWMLKKNQDFAHMETAARNIRGYCGLVAVLCVVAAVTFWAVSRSESERLFFAIFWLCLAGVAFGYRAITKLLLLNPMRGHEKWIEANGIFSTKPKASAQVSKPSDVSIVQGGRLAPYSVADELIKWSKLKDDGHITVEQYNAAKEKLLTTPTA